MALQNELAARLYKSFERVTGAIKQIDNDHAYIHQSKMFSTFHKATIVSGGTLAFGFKTPAVGYVHYRLAGISPSADKLDTQIFENATFTAETGTLLVNTNRNRENPIVSTVELRVAPTFTANGTLLDGLSTYLPGSEGVGQARSGSVSEAKNEVVLKQNTTYRFLATNGSTSANTIGFNFQWYEEELG